MDPINQIAAPQASRASTAPKPSADVAIAFDQMLMRTVVETMLPKGGEAFGGGIGADMWRSQLADAVAGQMARSGAVSFAALAGLTPEKTP